MTISQVPVVKGRGYLVLQLRTVPHTMCGTCVGAAVLRYWKCLQYQQTAILSNILGCIQILNIKEDFSQDQYGHTIDSWCLCRWMMSNNPNEQQCLLFTKRVNCSALLQCNVKFKNSMWDRKDTKRDLAWVWSLTINRSWMVLILQIVLS